MKQFLELENDCIIKYKFIEKRIDHDKIDWVDAENKKANGRNSTEGVAVFVKEWDSNGYTGLRRELWLSKNDILTLADNIKRIDAEENVIGIPNYDLPF